MENLGMYLVKRSDIGCHGNLFGGTLMAWADASAVGYAMRLSGEPRMLTHTMEHSSFLKTVKEGELVSIFGFPWQLGTTSLSLAIEAQALNLHSQEQNTVMRICCMRFVCVDAQGTPKAIGEAGRRRIEPLIEGLRRPGVASNGAQPAMSAGCWTASQPMLSAVHPQRVAQQHLVAGEGI